MRRYAGTLDQLPPPKVAPAPPGSAVSRRFLALRQEQWQQRLTRSRAEVNLPVVMIGGIHLCDRIILVALGIDRGKALRRVIVDRLGATAQVQRCEEHKRRNAIEHLPHELHASVGRALRDICGNADGTMLGADLGAVPNVAHHQPNRELERLDQPLHAQRHALERQRNVLALGGRYAE